MLCIPSSCVMERGGWKPNVEISPTCPRCGSTNTKFCYYNNYCLTQPRYFCKGCRRYWTRGGSLRNVPIGGGCRKSRRGKPIRVSTDHGHGGVSSRGLSGLGRYGNQLAEASSSMPGLDGPNNIDLAVVYANFLNQKPQNEADQLEIPQFSNNVGSSFEFSSVHSMHLAQHSGVLECAAHTQILTDGNAIYDHCGLDSIDQNHQVIINPHFTSTSNHTSNYVLPPLPGEELLVSEGMVWPTTTVDAMLHHQMLHVTHSSGLTPEVLNPNPVSGNECPFNLSNYDFSGLGK